MTIVVRTKDLFNIHSIPEKGVVLHTSHGLYEAEKNSKRHWIRAQNTVANYFVLLAPENPHRGVFRVHRGRLEERGKPRCVRGCLPAINCLANELV